MTQAHQTHQTPQDGIAEAIGDLSEQSRILVRREVDSAQREMWEKAKDSAPALAFLVAAGTFGLLTTASSYRLSVRVLETRLSPATAAFAATAGYGSAAVCAAVLAARQIRELPSLFPARTVSRPGRAVAGAAAEVGR